MNRRAIPDGAIESQWTAADGYVIRRIDWAPPVFDPNSRDGQKAPRGSILFMAGRGEAYEKYLETFEDWRQAGWFVTASDWRGQAGSGRLGDDDVTGHIDDFSHWVADLKLLWTDWAKERTGHHVLVGHSMGGHLTLRAAGEEALSPMPDALVLSTPMLDMQPEAVPVFIRHLFAWAMGKFHGNRQQAWKWSEKPGELPPGRQDLLTHDDDRYSDELWWRDQRPEVVMGPGSWGWVTAAHRSVRCLNRRNFLEQVEAPVLLIGTQDDKMVSMRAIVRAQKRLPKAETLWLGPEALHEVLREVDAVRATVLDAVDDFLARHCP